MAQQIIAIGAANAGLGDDYFTAFTKIQANFDELYPAVDAIKSPARRVVVNELSNFPVPDAGLITLDPSTQYLIGDDVDLGTNSIELKEGSTIRGIDSITVSLTYTGTGDMFIGVDAAIKISNVKIICATGRFMNWSDSLGKVLRLADLSITCDRFGLFNGSNSSMRMTNVSPTVTATNGMLFTGTWLILLYEVSLANISAGKLIDLGTAVFDGLAIASVTSNIAAGATFLSGLAGSANISVGGTGSVFSTTLSGAGTRLSGVSVDDARWQFLLNDDIADTRPDGLLSMQGNATETEISAANAPVKVAGTWVVKSTSQMTGTTDGRLTYNGGKDAKLPITLALSAAPVSGTNVKMSAYVAINGITDSDSKVSGTANSGQPVPIVIPWQENFPTDKYVEVFIENNDNTTNILVSSAIMRVN